MSVTVQQEIEAAAAAVKRGRGESDEDYAKHLIEKITDLSDKDWAKLSAEAQAWFNEAVDAMNDNKDIPAFPDAAEKPATRRGAAKVADAPVAGPITGGPQAGDTVIVTTKRGKVYEGEFIELDGDTAVVKVGDEEMEFTADRTESLVVKEAEAEHEEVVTDGSNVEVGDMIRAVTKRNKEVFGQVVEVDGPILVVDQGKDGEVEVDTETAKEIQVTQKKEEKKPTGRAARGTTAAPATPEKEKKVSIADNGGVSVTTRMREILCANPDMSADALAKQLDKEKLVYKKPTMLIVHKDVMKVIELLKANKHFK